MGHFPLWQAWDRAELLTRPHIRRVTDPTDLDRLTLICRTCKWQAEFLSSYQARLAYEQHQCPPKGGE